MALCTIEDVELYLQVTYTDDPSIGTDEADRVEYLINAVSAEIETICYRTFSSTDYVEVYDGNGENSIFLNQYPINTITKIDYGYTVDGSARTELTDGYVSYADTGQVTFMFNSLEAPQMFEVTYNAGYNTIPLDLNLIAVEEVVRALGETTKDQNLKSEKLGDYSYSLTSSSENKKNLTVKLSKYIRTDI